VLAGAATFLAAATPVFAAGTFSVRACGAAGGVNRSWTLLNQGGGTFEAPSVVEGHPACDPTAGLWAQDRLGAGDDPAAGTEVRFTFSASPGTAVVGVAYDRRFYKLDDNAWDPAFLRTAETPVGSPLDGRCTFDPVEHDDCGTSGPQTRTFTGTSRLEFGLRCGPGTVFGIPTTTCLHGAAGGHYAIAQLRSAEVTVADAGTPVMGALSGVATTQTYLRGAAATVAAPAVDASGIRSAQVLVDGADTGPLIAGTCNTVSGAPFAYVTPKPCADRGPDHPLTGTVDVSGIADGPHTLSLRATDAAGNAGDAPPRTVVVDQTPPGPPVGLEVTSAAPGRAGWELAPPAAMSWSAPSGQVAPVVTSHVRACREGGACRTTAVAGLALDAAALAGLLDQGDGAYLVEVSLSDAAGNGAGFDAARASGRRILLDGTAPAAPASLSGGGVRPGPEFSLSWVLPAGQVSPLTAIHLRLCATPIGDCTHRTLPGSATSAAVILPLADADFRASIWAQDEAGNADEARAAETVLCHHPEADPGPRPGADPDSAADSPSGNGTDPGPGTGTGTPGVPDPSAVPAPAAPRARTPRLRLAASRYTPATRRLTLSGTAAAGFGARAVVRLAIAPRAGRNEGGRRAVTASRAARIAADRHGRFTVTITLARSTARAIRAARRTTVTLVTRGTPAWRAATATRTLVPVLAPSASAPQSASASPSAPPSQSASPPGGRWRDRPRNAREITPPSRSGWKRSSGRRGWAAASGDRIPPAARLRSRRDGERGTRGRPQGSAAADP